YMRQESQQPLSPFYNSLSGKTALAGHSMGGGCAVLAASSAYDIDALVTFAAAETNPSAIAAAAGVTAPALFFIGERDCVTPYGQHQEGMFSRLASGCKYLLSIKDGMHCYFANYNFNCTFGESTCQPTPSINRNDQHAVVFRYLIPFLQSTLKGNCEAWDAMRDSMAYDSQLAMTLDTCSHVCLGCDEPTGLTVKRITPYSARLCWDTTTHATGYRIRGKPLQAGVWKYLLVAGGSTPCRDVYGLTNQTVYVWQVQAVCDTAFSGWSMADTFTAVCRPPDSLFAGPIAATAARLNWLPVTGAYAYEIKGKRLGSPVWVSLVTTGNSKTVYGLIPSTTYLWKVRTLCHATGAIASVFSAVDTFTTQALRVMSPTGYAGLRGNDRVGVSAVDGAGCFPSGEPAASGQLFDLMGKAVSPRIDPCDRSALRRHLEALPPGIYLLRYRGGVKKVIHGE
ncbi:MAG: fibronectin type III domain-containing protein, partial [Chloroflexi bacterium]